MGSDPPPEPDSARARSIAPPSCPRTPRPAPQPLRLPVADHPRRPLHSRPPPGEFSRLIGARTAAALRRMERIAERFGSIPPTFPHAIATPGTGRRHLERPAMGRPMPVELSGCRSTTASEFCRAIEARDLLRSRRHARLAALPTTNRQPSAGPPQTLSAVIVQPKSATSFRHISEIRLATELPAKLMLSSITLESPSPCS